MVCNIVKSIGLYIFWKCIDEETREKNIKEHRYSKIKVEDVQKKVEYIEETENEVEKIKLVIKELNKNIKNMTFEEVETKLIEIEAELEKL